MSELLWLLLSKTPFAGVRRFRNRNLQSAFATAGHPVGSAAPLPIPGMCRITLPEIIYDTRRDGVRRQLLLSSDFAWSGARSVVRFLEMSGFRQQTTFTYHSQVRFSNRHFVSVSDY
jgi:hypothetical protein